MRGEGPSLLTPGHLLCRTVHCKTGRSSEVASELTQSRVVLGQKPPKSVCVEGKGVRGLCELSDGQGGSPTHLILPSHTPKIFSCDIMS